MSTLITFNGVSYSIPASGEIGWSTLSSFLIALGNNAAITEEMKQAIRVATTTPVTVSATADFCVVSDLTAPGAVAVNLPAGVSGQVFVIVDGKGDASSNNITVTPNGGDTIKGAASLVLDHNRQALILQYHAGTTDWKVLANIVYPGTITSADFTGVLAIAKGGTNSGTALNNNRVMQSSGSAIVEAAAITASRALISDANGIPTHSTVTDAQLAALPGDVAGKQPLDATLTALAGLDATAGLVVETAADTFTKRSLASGSSKIAVSNADGVSGNPTVDAVEGNFTLNNIGGTLGISKGGTGQTTANAAFDALSPMTTNGDLITRSGGVPARLGVGTDGQVLGVSSGLPAWTDSGAGGSGELNMVTNPSAASATTGWTTTGANGPTVARTTTSGDLPLENQVATALKITSATAAGAEASHYLSITLTPGEALKNKKHKVEIYMRPGTNFIASEWTVSVYSGATRMVLSTDSSGFTYLPNGTGKFTTTFDADSSTSYTLRFARPVNAGANAAVLNITNVIVGPGIQPQGAVVEQARAATTAEKSWTITNTTGTITSLFLTRIGESIRAQGVLDITGAATGTIFINPPASLACNTATVSQGFPCGVAMGRDNSAGQRYSGTVNFVDGSGFRFTGDGSNGETWDADNPVVWASGDSIYFDITYPVSSFAGSGTLNVAQNDVEYAYNTDVSATASVTGSGFGYGPGGVNFPSANWTIGTKWTRRVQFQTPIQATDKIFIETDGASGGLQWYDASASSQGYVATQANGTKYGISQDNIGANYIDLAFSAGGLANGAATYGANGTAWTTQSALRWRVRKVSGGQAVGFGEVVPGTSSGLVSASGLKGNTTGNAIASDYVGQILTSGQITAGVSTSGAALGSLVVTPGVWMLVAQVTWYGSGTSGVNGFYCALNTTSGSVSGTAGVDLMAATVDATNEASGVGGSATTIVKPISISANTTYYLNCAVVAGSVGSGGYKGSIQAIRIA